MKRIFRKCFPAYVHLFYPRVENNIWMYKGKSIEMSASVLSSLKTLRLVYLLMNSFVTFSGSQFIFKKFELGIFEYVLLLLGFEVLFLFVSQPVLEFLLKHLISGSDKKQYSGKMYRFGVVFLYIGVVLMINLWPHLTNQLETTILFETEFDQKEYKIQKVFNRMTEEEELQVCLNGFCSGVTGIALKSTDQKTCIYASFYRKMILKNEKGQIIEPVGSYVENQKEVFIYVFGVDEGVWAQAEQQTQTITKVFNLKSVPLICKKEEVMAFADIGERVDEAYDEKEWQTKRVSIILWDNRYEFDGFGFNQTAESILYRQDLRQILWPNGILRQLNEREWSQFLDFLKKAESNDE